MSSEKPVENLMKNTMESLRDMVDVNTVIGDPVETKDGTYIIPVSRLNFGFVSGGSELSASKVEHEEKAFPFGGGSGAGVSVKPVAFLVIKDDSVRLLPVDHDSPYDRVFDSVPQVIDMVAGLVKDLTNRKNKKMHNNHNDGNINFEGSTSTETDIKNCD